MTPFAAIRGGETDQAATWVTAYVWPAGQPAVGVLASGALWTGLGVVLLGLMLYAWLRRRNRPRGARSAPRPSELIEHLNGVLWEADVRLETGDWTWQLQLHPSVFCRQLFQGRVPRPGQDLWEDFQIGTRAEMNRLAREAMVSGQSGYEQEFRAVRDGRTYCLHENVSIARLGLDHFRLVGLVTDLTALREAEAARTRSEQTVVQLLSQAQCMLWRATVIEEAGGLAWSHFDTPESLLSAQLFGPNRIYDRARGYWDGLVMPDQREMDQRGSQAIRVDATGYEQQFRAITRAGRTFWLHEQVSITRLGARSWTLVGVITDITAQRQAEEAHQQSESRLAHLLERADSMIWQARVERSPGGPFLWSMYVPRSKLYRRIFASDPQDPIGFAWKEHGVPEHEQIAQRAEAAITGGAPGYDQIFHVPGPAGDIWLSESVTISPIGSDVWDLVGIIHDITTQHVAESARHASEQRLQELLTRADCILWEATVELSAEDWTWQFRIQPSLLWRKLQGAGRPQAEPRLWRNFEIPERAAMNGLCRTAMIEGRPGYEHVFHIIGPDGTATWIRENVTIRAAGERRFSLVGVAVDITLQRGAEDALAAEKERLSVTLRAMHESVITTDISGRIQFMNPAAAALTGWEPGECEGLPVERVCVLENVRNGERVEVPVSRVALGDVVADLPMHTRLVTRAGPWRLVEGCCAPIHAMDSRVTGAVLVLRDVTEQERLEQELVRATRLESVGVLAGGIAHDFNNILTAVMGNLSLAQLDLPAGSPAGNSVRSAEKAALRARDLTQQLLTFAKGGEPVRAAIQLEAVVREMATFALHGSTVKAHYDLAPDLWPADADKGQIGRVVQNLVINAVQAMPHGGTLRIIARNDPHGGVNQPGLAHDNYIQMTITDTGEGIKPENIARIFDPYFTTKQSGTGLGLAAVYSIIKKHRGHIEVESQPGQGTTFRFWLPALSGASTSERLTPPAGGPERPVKGRVLFMDDEAIIREMAMSLLGRFGLQVDCAADGAEAVEKYRAALAAGCRHDLVIMDLTVPGGMGGLEALAKLRALDPDVRAVVSSGYSSDPVLARHRNHGFAAVLAKPYEVNEVARVLRELLPKA
ncbi:Blue-light-activated protein [Lacunisphaera limnophila]|uniref:histidine kinase n=1 Tax=Lacunisphaera limnophila TaxID=1838286 RepID=A0A1D8AWZ6_9BACT|nr:PAS domain-containing sensor histidine kinase [Lacunisphaera limnophila]AOS45418.1 Blue-light-activated protein [Lacunisphaera limnophila]